MNQTIRSVAVVAGFVTAALGGCQKTKAPEPKASAASASAKKARAEPAPEPTATSTNTTGWVRGAMMRDRLPVPADFVEEAAKTINEQNYVKALDELERDYATE